MGADLYLNSVFRKHRDRYAPKFDHWVGKRNALHKAGQREAAERAQKQVLKYYGKMHERLKAFLRQAIDRKESIQCSL
jgi:hypothetical protein